jgi:hypothetical protein
LRYTSSGRQATWCNIVRIEPYFQLIDTCGRRKPRRWVVERTLAWLSKCRALLIRYDKHDVNYLGLIQLACALLWYRRVNRLQAGAA